MPIQPLQFGQRSNPNRNDTQGTLVNCYAENLGTENEAQWALYACDGFEAFSTLTGAGVGVVRGWLNLDDTSLITVAGSRINSVSTLGVATDLGALSTTGTAYLARNRKTPNAQVAIVTSDGLFRIVENGVVTTPSVDPDIPTFNSVCGTDGYLIFTCESGEWFISSIDEGGTIDDLEFAQANTNPDNATLGIVRGRDVLICGPKSVEAYQNTGQTDFPFERVTSIDIGLAYPPAAVNVSAVVDDTTQDTVIFPANNSDGAYAGVMILAGYQAKKISTPDVDRCIRDETDKSSLRAYTRVDNGHVMYVLTGSTFTREYNCDTGAWCQRKSSGLSVYRCVAGITFNGQQILADCATGTLYRQSHSLIPASASTVALRHSNTNGSTWISRSAKAVGTTGQSKVLRWHALGQSKEDGKVLEFTFSNAIVENSVGTDMVVITPPVHAFPKVMEFNQILVNVPARTSQTASAKGFYNLAADINVLEA